MIIYVCLDILPTKHPTVVSPALRINHPIPTFLHFVMTSLHPLSGIVPYRLCLQG